MADELPVCAVSELTPGTVAGAGHYAVGNASGRLFAVSRRCRHLGADLAGGSIDKQGYLVCPWHGARSDVETGRMVRGPQGVYAKVPGLGAANIALTRILPLRRGGSRGAGCHRVRPLNSVSLAPIRAARRSRRQAARTQAWRKGANRSVSMPRSTSSPRLRYGMLFADTSITMPTPCRSDSRHR
jgi:nitrite reductase/ring-hydroxylating ferredoxin subunit